MCLKLLMPSSLALLTLTFASSPTLIFAQWPLMASVSFQSYPFHSYSNSALQWQMIQMQLKNPTISGQLIQYLTSA